jgi:hypothetical protein
LGRGGGQRKELYTKKNRETLIYEKLSDCVKNKSNFENRIAIHFAFVEQETAADNFSMHSATPGQQ